MNPLTHAGSHTLTKIIIQRIDMATKATKTVCEWKWSAKIVNHGTNLIQIRANGCRRLYLHRIFLETLSRRPGGK